MNQQQHRRVELTNKQRLVKSLEDNGYGDVVRLRTGKRDLLDVPYYELEQNHRYFCADGPKQKMEPKRLATDERPEPTLCDKELLSRSYLVASIDAMGFSASIWGEEIPKLDANGKEIGKMRERLYSLPVIRAALVEALRQHEDKIKMWELGASANDKTFEKWSLKSLPTERLMQHAVHFTDPIKKKEVKQTEYQYEPNESMRLFVLGIEAA